MGAFGVMGLVLALLAKAVLLFSLPKEQLFFAIPLAATTGRWALVLAALQPSARPGGLGDMTKQGMRKSSWLLAALQMLVMLAVAVFFRQVAGSHRVWGGGSFAYLVGLCERAQKAGRSHWRYLWFVRGTERTGCFERLLPDSFF